MFQPNRPNRSPMDANKALAYCGRLLAAREYSQRQLRDKLKQKGCTSEVISQVLNELVAQGWQSDSRFAESFVRSRIGKGQGERRIRFELEQLVNDQSLIDEAFAAQNIDWLEQCSKVLAKKMSGKKPPLSQQERLKVSRFLNYRGFPSQLGSRVISQWEQQFKQ